MRWVVPLLLLLWVAPGLASVRSSESCGRMVVQRAERAARNGKRVLGYPRSCPKLKLPDGYYAENGPAGEVVIYRSNGVRVMRLLPQPKFVPAKHGVIGTEIWEQGRRVGTVTVHNDGGVR